jgi:hypothetical protein
METSKSERVRMQAELRAAERSISKEPDVQPAAPVQAEETDAVTAARAFIAKLGNRANGARDE